MDSLTNSPFSLVHVSIFANVHRGMAKLKGRYDRVSLKTILTIITKEGHDGKDLGSSFANQNSSKKRLDLDLSKMDKVIDEEALTGTLDQEESLALISQMENIVTKMKEKVKKSWAD
ncbi:hypothetical protein RIF29_20748 [Crotalaria pallida]|uniref:Uncharacterized protein n=1 Tax=Crotalaria pallida TaxID=3830 RepID=A0AAN9F637_CROPI